MELVLSMSQKLLLSQKMLQSTEILQMSSSELLDYISEMSVENPVVDYEQKEDSDDTFTLLRKKLDYLDESDEQNRTYYKEDKEDEGDNDDWKFKGSMSQSLEEYLLDQVNVLQVNRPLCALCRYLVCSIDRNGYLHESLEDISTSLKVPITFVEEALTIIQSFEPTGVGARNLSECLVLQLKKLDIDTFVAQNIVENSIDLLGKNQINAIIKKLKITHDQVTDAIAIIKKLNPKPGNSFSGGEALEYIVPDAIITKGKNGYEIVLNDKFFPNIGINTYYKTMLDETSDTKTKEYVSNKIKQAQWVMECIEKRNKTLTRTLETIVSIQNDFFEKGIGHLNPMCLNDIANTIQMHESTVSRAVKQKYIQCQHGVFPLSYFFQTSISASTDGKNTTPEKIKIMIKEIIDEEDSKSPFSDRAITEKLVAQGIEISRRTVAKYREAMGILGTSGRKG